MPFVVIKKGDYFFVKNTKTGKVGSDRFKTKENADIQRKNRERFIRLVASKTELADKKKKGKKGKNKK